MSVKVMTAVFDRYPNGGGEMLLALSLADHSHDDGTHIYPSVDSLAKKTRQSVRSVQYQLKGMTESGWLILTNEGDGGRGFHREYRISSEWIKGAEIAPIQKGADSGDKGADSGKEGCNPLHPPYNHKEPSVNHQSAARASRISPTWKLPKPFGEWALVQYPDWTPEFIRERGDKFRDHWSAVPGKAGLKTDWLATWRNFCLAEAEFIARTTRTPAAGASGAPWWSSDALILAEGARRRLTPRSGESIHTFKGRVQADIDGTAGARAPAAPVRPVLAPSESAPASDAAVAARNAALKDARAMLRSKVVSP